MISRLVRFQPVGKTRLSSALPAGARREFSQRRRPAPQPPSSVFRVSEEVQDALSAGRSVVALETAIVTHGMPEPHNVDVAHMVEGRVRAEGAVPATVGILDGKVVVGLNAQELKLLAEASREKRARKVSRRDLAVALAERCMGGTTVSTTMMAAHWAGIHVFVTGGIGGVHRDGQNSLDVSADLTELGRTPVAVVCAGCKSILDIGRTLEYLETQGVPTITVGEKVNFPAFFAPDSGFQASHRVSTATECAHIVDASLRLSLDGGLVIGVPIPSDEGEAVEQAIQQALEEAKSASIAGRDVTPFVLGRVNELSAGKSLAANIELIKNNATVGSQIAVELTRLQENSGDGKGGAGGGDNGISHAWNRTATGALFGSSSHSSNGGQSQSMQMSSNGNLRQEQRVSFGSPPPSFPSMQPLGNYGSDGMTTFGNVPPPEYADNIANSTSASSIDNDLMAEFQALLPDEYRTNNQLAETVHPPHQPTREYHTSSRRFVAAKAQSSNPIHSDQARLDAEHFSKHEADFARLKSLQCPVVVGAAVVDVVAKPTDGNIKLHLTNNCQVTTSYGGVGRNVAEAMMRCGHHPLVISAIGADESQSAVRRHLESVSGSDRKWCSLGIRPCAEQSTATYMAVLDDGGSLFTGVGNFDVVELISPEWLQNFEAQLKSAPIVILDGNLTVQTLDYTLNVCGKHSTPVWFEPACTVKAAKIYATSSWQHATVISPNFAELQAMARLVTQATGPKGGISLQAALDADVTSITAIDERRALCLQLAEVLLPHHPCLLVTLDKDGVLLVRRRVPNDLSDENLSFRQYIEQCARHATSSGDDMATESRLYSVPCEVAPDSIVSVSGAGDSLVGAAVACLLDDALLSIADCIEIGLKAARTSLGVAEAINPQLSLNALRSKLE